MPAARGRRRGGGGGECGLLAPSAAFSVAEMQLEDFFTPEIFFTILNIKINVMSRDVLHWFLVPDREAAGQSNTSSPQQTKQYQ